MQPSTTPWKLLIFRQLPENKRVTCRKKKTPDYRINSRVVRRNIYLCIEQITRNENVPLDLHIVECCCRFIKRGDLLRSVNLSAEVAIELHLPDLPEPRAGI